MKLSPRELQVIEAVSNGQRPCDFADEHGIARQTVSNFITSAQIKLDCTTFEQACVKFATKEIK
jgi:DNA-binding CsgD family transcriptional regulator